MALQATVSGGLTLAPTPGVAPTGSSGCKFGLALRTENSSPASESSQAAGVLESPAAFVSLGVQAGLQARVFYIRLETASSIDIELTQLVTGVTVISNVLGMFLIEVSPADAITGIRLQGSAKYEWAAFGPVV